MTSVIGFWRRSVAASHGISCCRTTKGCGPIHWNGCRHGGSLSELPCRILNKCCEACALKKTALRGARMLRFATHGEMAFELSGRPLRTRCPQDACNMANELYALMPTTDVSGRNTAKATRSNISTVRCPSISFRACSKAISDPAGLGPYADEYRLSRDV